MKQIFIISLMLVMLIFCPAGADLAWYLPFDEDMSEFLSGDTPTKTNGTPTIAGSEGLAVGGAGDGDGGALDLRSNPFMGQNGPAIAYGARDTTTSVFQSEVYGAQSLTYCGWFNTKSSVSASNGARISAFNVEANFTTMMHGSTDGMIRSAINGSYTNSGSPAWDGADEWVFFAVTYDSTAASENLKWYAGGLDTGAVTLVNAVDFAKGPISTANQPTARRFVVGAGDYFNGGSGFDGLIDELRMYTSKTDGSGALTASEITEVKNLVLPFDPEDDCPEADLDGDCCVDLADLDMFVQQWLGTGCSGEGCGDFEPFDGQVDIFDFAVLAKDWQECGTGTWRNYSFYEPTITRNWIVNSEDNLDNYNHASTLKYFDGKWVALWNGNPNNTEGQIGQSIYMSTSSDLISWSTPVRAVFSDSAYSTNPVPWSATGGEMQWQPCTVVTDTNELWCIWRQAGSGPVAYEGIWLSKLTDVNGKWTNELIFDSYERPDGHSYPDQGYNLSAATDGIQLQSGRIMFPVTMKYGAGWAIKNCGVIYTDNGGATWHLTEPVFHDNDETEQVLEPSIWEHPDTPNTLYMIARSNDDTAPVDERILYATSTNSGVTWTTLEHLSIIGHKTRGYATNIGDRNMMIHNDYPGLRLNIAMFFNRGAGVDFVAGPSLSESLGMDPTNWVSYPQFGYKDASNMAAIFSYRSENSSSSNAIMVAEISALPDPDTYYLFPRYSHVQGQTNIGRVNYNSGTGEVIFNDDFASAGIDLDENDPSANNIEIHFEFKVNSGSKNTIMSLGHPGKEAKIFADNGTVKLKEYQGSSTTVSCGPYSGWTVIDVQTGLGVTKVSVDGGPWCSVNHSPDMNTLYFGEGFIDQTMSYDSGDEFVIDIDSILIRVSSQ